MHSHKFTIVIAFILATLLAIFLIENVVGRAKLVDVRNSIFAKPYTTSNLEGSFKPYTNQKHINDVFNNFNALKSFDDFIEFRKKRILGRKFSNQITFQEILDDCFAQNNKYMCGCSDISAVIIAFCSFKNELCFEIIKGSSHSFVYNKTKDITFDFFYGFVFQGSPTELIKAALSGSLEENEKFLDLGQWIPNSVIDEQLGESKNLIYDFKNLSYNDTNEYYLKQHYPNLKQDWNKLIINVLGQDDTELSIQTGNYYWTGKEWFFPIVEWSKIFGNNSHRIFKEILGRALS